MSQFTEKMRLWAWYAEKSNRGAWSGPALRTHCFGISRHNHNSIAPHHCFLGASHWGSFVELLGGSNIACFTCKAATKDVEFYLKAKNVLLHYSILYSIRLKSVSLCLVRMFVLNWLVKMPLKEMEFPYWPLSALSARPTTFSRQMYSLLLLWLSQNPT